MLTVADATDVILGEVRRPAPVPVPLSDALGLILAEDVKSDVDSPPFDKALMDGYAVRAADVATGRAELRLLEEIMAGQVPQKTLQSGDATRIMTGAPIPQGADAVVRVEETRVVEKTDEQTIIVIDGAAVVDRQHIMNRGTATRCGDRVLSAGALLRPQEIGVLAESGKATVAVFSRPRAAILATGDELVPVSQNPELGQIRNSNEAMLAAQLERAGATPVRLGIARDDRAHLHERIEVGLDCDLLLLSGGVSAGKRDLVPSVLEEAGVRCLFHKVRVKPGKPLWFGISERLAKSATGHSKMCYVFGLPGNPVSSMVCCDLFVRTALRRLLGVEPAAPTAVPATLVHDHPYQGNRPTYHPAYTEVGREGRMVKIVPWQGSSDLRATTAANCTVHLPQGDCFCAAGSVLDVFLW